MNRKQFTFYESFAAAISRIRIKSARCDAYDAVVNYAIRGVEPDMDALPDAVAIAFDLIRPTLDTAAKRSLGGTIRAAGQRAGSAAAQRQLSRSSASAQPQLSGKEKEKEAEAEIEIEIEIESESETENECSDPPASPFEKFWAAYPRKIGKAAARRAFAQTDVPLETLLAAIGEQKRSEQWRKEGGSYIPSPATWLSQGRWEDELPRPPGSGGQKADLAALRRTYAYISGCGGSGKNGESGGREEDGRDEHAENGETP